MRILFVAFPLSIHTSRWINQVTDQGWDLHLAPSVDQPLNTYLRGKIRVHSQPNRVVQAARSVVSKLLARWPHHRGSGHAFRLRERIQMRIPQDSAKRLEQIIRKVQPDIIHSMEMQRAGYLVSATKERMGSDFPTWLMSNWGSDTYLYHRIAEHQERVKQVLQTCDYFAADCVRDVKLAQTLGLQAKPMPVLPGAGGFDLAYWHRFRHPSPTSKRRVILMKGYQHWAGRAMAGLRAIELCADVIGAGGYSVLIYLASPDMHIAAELASHATGIPITIVPFTDYEDAMRRYSVARVHIGLSISDGATSSLLESMVMGTFPIQSCTACADEWIEDGKGGFIVPPEDPQAIAAALHRALTDDELVDRAAQINDETARRRLDYAHVKAQAVDMYQAVYAASKRAQDS